MLDAGIVHKNIERADLDFESIDSFSHRGMIGDVERERPHVAAEKSGGLLQLGSVPPVQNDLGAGASMQTWTYLSTGGGPPFRRIVDSGIRAGVGTDSTNVSALDPWLSLFYMTTGRNLAGTLTTPSSTVRF